MPQRSPASSSLATLSEVPGTELRQLQATFESFREFVERYSPWLSDSNIFVETVEPVPVGAPVRLEIFLRDRPLLIRALGQVDWVRKPSDGGEDGPPGVALSITYLDPASARLIDSIFRLYTGQQSAAMGKDVVETWELDVESLIDQAFPGAEVSPEGAQGGKASKTASSGNDAGAHGTRAASETAPTTAAPAGTEAAVGAAAAVAAGAVAARSMAEGSEAASTAQEPASADAESLDWTLPEGVVVAEPGASAEAQVPEEPPAADDSLDWTLPEGVVVADPGPAPSAEASGVEPPPAAPADASKDDDSLDWTLPEGVVVADPDRTLETQALQIPQEAADLPEELSDIEPDVELPDVELPDVELPDIEIPVELEEAAAPEKDAPAEAMPAVPALPAAKADPPEVTPPTAEPPAWADSELAPRTAADEAVADPAASAAFPDPTKTVRVAIPPAASDSVEEAEWEAKLSSAFSEYEEGGSSEVVPPDDVALPEAAPPVAENAGFGFGLVQESDVEPEEASGEPSQLEPAALEPAALEPAALQPVTSEPIAPEPVAPPLSPTPTTPVQPSPLLEQPTLEAEEPSANAVQQVAGAASVADESDATFLRRSVLAFLLAVVAVGLLFFWYRGQSTPPSGETTIAQAPVDPSPAPESPPPPTGATPGEAETPSAAIPPAETPSTSTPSGEPSAAPAAVDPAPSAPVAEEPTPVETTAPPVESGSEVEPSPSVDPPSPPPPEPVTPPPPPPPVAAAQDPAEATAEIERLITGWAAAWSEQDVAGYIDSYGPDYSPSDLGRKAWENQRKVRIQAPASLLVLAKDISVEILSATRARATFYQDYETDTKHLYTWKTMDLERLGESWRIVGERKGR